MLFFLNLFGCEGTPNRCTCKQAHFHCLLASILAWEPVLGTLLGIFSNVGLSCSETTMAQACKLAMLKLPPGKREFLSNAWFADFALGSNLSQSCHMQSLPCNMGLRGRDLPTAAWSAEVMTVIKLTKVNVCQ